MEQRYQKSILDTYTTANTAVAVDGLLPLEQNNILTGCSITHVAGSTTVSLVKPGQYLVAFNADGTTSGTAGNISVQLYNNGVAVPGAISTAEMDTTIDTGNVSFTKVISVKPSCCVIDNTANLTFVNTGVATLYTNINVNVIKLC